VGLSFQCVLALTPLASTLAIDSEFLSCSVDAGFVLALPLHHGDLELDSVGVSTKSYLKIISVGMAMVGGAYSRDKYTCARTLAEMLRS